MNAIEALADAHGILTRYVGYDGETYSAKPEALEAVLSALTSRGVNDQRLVDPVAVIWGESPLRVVPSEPVQDASLLLEDGRSMPVPLGRAGDALELVDVPHGYHRLRVSSSSRQDTCLVLCAPERAYRALAPPRKWGLFAPVYAIGAGRLSNLGELLELVADHGGHFAGTLPLLPTFDFDPSPYAPISRLFWNERFVDEVVPRTGEPSPLALEYAHFRATLDGDASRVNYYLDAQSSAERQLEGLVGRAHERHVGLYLDLPLGVHRKGFDIYREPRLFPDNVDVGAPPDALYSGGQNWSFPPILPGPSRESGHDYFRRVVHHAMRHADILRIDHVMGLHRQFWIPVGWSARDGVYVRYPANELYAILSLESHRARCVLVGENLGTVPPEVDESLERHAILGLRVLQFTLAEEQPARDTMASIDTHDTPTFSGFCRSEDPARRNAVRSFDERLTLSSPSEMERLEAWLEWLLSSEAEYVSVTLEDLWLEEDPQNVPGTTSEHANWTRKLRYALNALPADTRRLLARLRRAST